MQALNIIFGMRDCMSCVPDILDTPSSEQKHDVLGLLGLGLLRACKDQFDAKVYGIVIQSLVEEPGLPTLFMRTVIQVVAWLKD